MLTTPAQKWALYDQLIDLAAPNQTVVSFESGRFWIMVASSAGGVGLAQRPGSDQPAPSPVGLSLKEAAAWVKSWDFDQAAVGLAVINAAINANPLTGPDIDAFNFFQEETIGKKVTVIGHFPYLENTLKDAELTILERNPRPGDLPDSAAEYVLPSQDYVFATGTTLINKTLPRLLELSPKAIVTIVGPSTPLTPSLFDYGIRALSGLIATNTPQLAAGIRGDACGQIFKSGTRKVNLLRP